MINLFRQGDITPRQDWLLDACFSELTYRQRHVEVYGWCGCEWCTGPFDDELEGQQSLL